jgi:hypothetical protein
MATSAGITRYSQKNDTWTHYTTAGVGTALAVHPDSNHPVGTALAVHPAFGPDGNQTNDSDRTARAVPTSSDGLSSDRVQAIAFDPRTSDIYLGTQCDGLCIGKRESDGSYKGWRTVRAHTNTSESASAWPEGVTGDGLPSDLINDVLVNPVTASGSMGVYVATTAGFAYSTDGGQTFKFLHRPPGKPSPGESRIPDNYVTCVSPEMAPTPSEAYVGGEGRKAELSPTGRVWLGFRETWRIQLFDPVSSQLVDAIPPKQELYAAAIATIPIPAPIGRDGNPIGGKPRIAGTFVGLCNKGLIRMPTEAIATPAPLPGVVAAAPPATPLAPPPPPSPAKVPTIDDLNAMLAALHKVADNAPTTQPAVVDLPDDWCTQGNWLGRYGRYWACLCGMLAPGDFVWGTGAPNVQYAAVMGPDHKTGDALRYYIAAPYENDPRFLEMPTPYADSRVQKNLAPAGITRRSATWDDHGEVYPRAIDGPDVYCTLTVPSGAFYLSLYEANRTGHDTSGRIRDFFVSIRDRPPGPKMSSITGFDKEFEFVRARVSCFYSGVWKRFQVRGPATLTIRIARNHSQNGNLGAMTLDAIDEYPAPYFDPSPQGRGEGGGQSASPGRSPAATVLQLLAQLETDQPAWHAARSRPFYAALARWHQFALATADDATAPAYRRCLATCYYHLQLLAPWEEQQRKLGLSTARQIERALRWDGRAKNDPAYDHDLVQAHRGAHSESGGRSDPQAATPDHELQQP